jgi:hypothetical protein
MDILRRKAKPQLKPPDTLSRYVVTKHAWYKAYKRIFCITPSAVHTQNPERTLVLTNSYSFAGDSDIESVTLGGDEFEFVISARQDKKVSSSCIPCRPLFRNPFASCAAHACPFCLAPCIHGLMSCLLVCTLLNAAAASASCHTHNPANRRCNKWQQLDSGCTLSVFVSCLDTAVPQGKFKPLKFSCKHRQLLMTDLYQCMAAANALGRCLLAAKVLG